MREGLDVVVVNYKTASDLVTFLESFEAHPPSCPWELWIMNVNPTGLDKRAGEKWRHQLGDRAHHCLFVENVGYARACNDAIQRGMHDIVAIFNADIILAAGALDECRDALLAHDDWGILGPRQIDERGRITASGIFGTVTAPKHRSFHDDAAGADGDRYIDVRDDAIYAAGSAMFAKRTVVDELSRCELGPGEFLLPTPHYYEESFACRHALGHGHKVAYLGTTTVVHLWHRASPIGGTVDRTMSVSKELFRNACDQHGLGHE